MKTIMKKLALTAAAIGWLFTTQAQEISGGIAAGVSTGTVQINSVAARGDLEGTEIWGLEAGLYGKLAFGDFYVRPHVLYGYQTGDIDFDRGGVSADYTTHNIQVPIYVGYKILGSPIAIEAAPVYNYAIDVTESYSGVSVKTGRNALGYRAGLAADFGMLIVNASYEGLTYFETSDRVELRQPGRIVAGVAVRLLGNDRDRMNRGTYRNDY